MCSCVFKIKHSPRDAGENISVEMLGFKKYFKKWVGHLCGALSGSFRGPETKKCSWNGQHTLIWLGNVEKQQECQQASYMGVLSENCIF